jgi:hypothetical protein
MEVSWDGQVSLDEVYRFLAVQTRVWVRAIGVRNRQTGDWEHAGLEITSGAAAPSWKRHSLKYGSAVFFAVARKGTSVVSWLRRGLVRIDGYRIQLPAINGPRVAAHRHGSRVQYIFEKLLWPSIALDLTPLSLAQQMPSESLMAPGQPTFYDFYAAASYFWGFLDGAPGGQGQRGVVYRHQDLGLRITRVVYGPERVHVEVEGPELAGKVLEVASVQPGPRIELTGETPYQADFSFPGGLSRSTWVLIRDDKTWLDRRFVNWPQSRNDQDDVVEEQAEIDPSSMIEYYLQHREGYQVEFKRALPEQTDELVKRVMKTVAAFANGDGGTLLFGITKEDEVIGVDRAGVDDDEDRLSDLIDRWVSPRPHWNFFVYSIDELPDRVVLALQVATGGEPPYAIGTNSMPPQYYVRHAARSVPAHPAELRALARGRPQAAAQDLPIPHMSRFA